MTSAGRPNFLSFNARSLYNKMEEIEILISKITPPPLFISVTESWCLANEPDSLYQLKDYILCRRDRQSTACGGGVLLYAHGPSLSALERLTHLEMANEDLWVLLTPRSSASLVICTTYRPPSADPEQFCANLEMSLSTAKTIQPRILITGDMNAKCHEWLPEDQTNTCGDNLQQLFCSYDLQQLVAFPTNYYAGQLKSCIDLVVTNIVGTTVSSLPPLGLSDHVVLSGCLPDHQPPPALPKRQVWCWSRSDVDGLKNAIETANWDSVLHCQNVEEGWSQWKTQILAIAQQFIPQKTVSSTKPTRPWVTPEIITHVKTKHRLYRRYQRTRTPVHLEEYRKQRNYVCILLRKAKSNFVESQLSDDQRSEPTHYSTHHRQPRLHQLLRCLLKPTSCDIPDLIVNANNQQRATSDVAKAEALNTFFISQARQSADSGQTPAICTPAATTTLECFDVSLAQVIKRLKQLDTRKASGGDGIHIKLLSMVGTEISPCIQHLFHLSLQSATIPAEWKEATISPIYKQKGSRSDMSNYRPISLLGILSKVLESIIAAQLAEHVERYLPVHQSGFRHNDGTAFQLARIIHQLAKGIDDGQHILSCYYDLSKAFDRVWHEGLLAKLEHLGVQGAALAWLKAYLTNRRQRVRVNNSFSTWSSVPAGVPQGSVLGPLLFLIYTSDLPEAVKDIQHTRCDQFADDTALTAVAPTPTDAEEHLQLAVIESAAWLNLWKLIINTKKTVVMETTRRPLPWQFTITLNEVPLSQVTSHKHLGITISSDLRWTAHVDSILAKASRLLGVLRRLRSSLSRDALCQFYIAYIRPILEYASIAWSNLTSTLATRLERLQRRAAKIILRRPLFCPSNHDEILAEIGWPTLSSRRTFHLAIFGYRLSVKNVPNHLISEILPEKKYTRSVRHPEHFVLPTANTVVFMNSPIIRASTVFNNLPASVRTAKSLTEFKQRACLELLSSLCSCTAHIRSNVT